MRRFQSLLDNNREPIWNSTRVYLKQDQSKSLELDDRILLQKKLSRGIVKSQRPRSKLDVE